MQGKVITFHSYKGGTGKSFLSLNTAAYLSQRVQGNVALIDFDFRAPTLIHKFKPDKQIRFLNDFLENRCTVDQILQDCSEVFQESNSTSGKFIVAYASPKTRDMQEMQMKTRQWQQKALTLLMEGLMKLKESFDWIILDSSPGVTYDSLNAMSSSDAVILVATPDRVDIKGTSEMTADLYASLIKFGAQPALVLNRIPSDSSEGKTGLYSPDYLELFEEETQIPVITRCPCFCDDTLLETTILISESPDHPLNDNIEKIAEYIRRLQPRE
ncbi:MAG: MinD/ParA family ATP-binding protein [Candidatus Hodarchaeales archaeon]